ncbi:Response regulator receiver domain-containing protein [Allopseudospirillum japonicum]|uniref:Response regulator receiver domain-containing protein n=1 Tax=Allopseudospirillum japonicum TaxID=64971 RepID=A0A1H6QQ49_9GAMM|nr:response regulator [Allopseudospirillum japonicum]SEI42367.1 Response regulator receiver domain-containing protein [Allopseudospirillum japonicum]
MNVNHVDKPSVMIVDDSAADISFLFNALAEKYRVQIANDGKRALEIAQGPYRPDVILMDVMMPEMDGYQTCRQIKENTHTQDICVIFISAHHSTEEKLKGYDAGGVDYLTKPVQPLELHQKIRLAIEAKQRQNLIIQEKNQAFSTAMTAITSAGELGVVLNFTRALHSVRHIQDLAKRLIQAMNEYQLNALVQIRTPNHDYYASSCQDITPLEKDLLYKLNQNGRILEYKQRSIFNFGDISLLIKCMPEGMDVRGRYRDTLALILETAVEKLKALHYEQALATLVEDAKEVLHQVDQQQLAHRKKTQILMDDLLKNLEQTFDSWGLSEEQENILIHLVGSSNDEYQTHFEQGERIDYQMRVLLKRLLSIPNPYVQEETHNQPCLNQQEDTIVLF